jgi:CRISPR system Cascade subunit CasB
MTDSATINTGSQGETLVPNQTFESVILSFWASLEGRRADRAMFRRCATPAEVVFVPAFHRLLRGLDEAGISVIPERLAVIAAVIAHVEKHLSAMDFASQLASGTAEKTALSSLRFRRLLAVDKPDELLIYLVRTVRLLDRTANVVDLARSIRFWSDDVRKRWAFRYYEKASKD